MPQIKQFVACTNSITIISLQLTDNIDSGLGILFTVSKLGVVVEDNKIDLN